MKKFLKHTLFFIAVAFLLVNAISLASFYFLRKSHFYKPQFVANIAEDINLDYAVLGSSTGLTTLNTTHIDTLTGLNGLNISIDDTSLNSHYLMLAHFLNNGGKIDQLILVVSPGDLANNEPLLSGNDYRFLPYVHQPYVRDYYSDFHTKQAWILKASQFVPILGVSYYNAELFYPSIKAAMKPTVRNRFDKKGNYVYPTQGGTLDSNVNRKEVKIAISNPYFARIRSLCKEKAIKLIVYQPPIYDRNIQGELEGLQFINHSELISDPSFFYDRIHVNRKGREVASSELSQLLNSL